MTSTCLTAARARRTIRRLALGLLCLGALGSGPLFAQPLAQVEYRLVGLALDVSPTTLTVPRGIATQLNTTLAGAQTLPQTAAVHATLRGPSFPNGLTLTATPGQPILLPAFPSPGLHFVEDIRLDVSDALSIAASPAAVTVNVLDELLVGAVSSRPLSLAEIQALGIEFDANSFQAFSFTIALTTASGVVNIDFPVLVPLSADRRLLVGSEIPTIARQSLPSLNLPNFAIEAVSLEPIVDLPPGVPKPSITGILVIPGSIAFLNQFFSVMLTVTNQAPDGTALVVRDLRATIGLPAGADGVVGDVLRDPPFAPGEAEFDNPLRIARTAAGRQQVRPILASGPDGAAGTSDDVDRLGPQESGNAEFLVEGVREGGHVVDIELRGVLEGLPGGPVEIVGHTRGSVVVRDPTFSLTFIHPDTVRAGEAYDLTVHIQNTSLVDANLVTVALDPRNLTGARLLNPTAASRVIPTIAAGESGTAVFRLEALRTGRVTASSLEVSGDAGAVTGRRLSLRAGVGELGTPLSPDTLLLPPSVGTLRDRAGNDDLIFRAIALLGEAHSIATAPRGSLAPGILPLTAASVIQRARELSEAGLRLELSQRPGAGGAAELRPDGLLLTLEDLYFDFLGAGAFDDGWDALHRRSRQARLFGAALAEVVSRDAQTLGLGDTVALQRHWADTESYRGDHVTVLTQSAGGELPVTLTLTDRLGRALGGPLGAIGGARQIPGADILQVDAQGAPASQLAVLTQADGAPYTGTLYGTRAGAFDLGVVVAAVDGTLHHIVFRGITVAAGDRLSITVRPRSTAMVSLERNGVALAPGEDVAIADRAPEVLGIVQRTDADIDQFGRVVALLFSEDIDPASVESSAGYAVSTATIETVPPPAIVDANQPVRALTQFGRRIVFLGLRDPVGPFVARRLSVSGARDLRGQAMPSAIEQPILADPRIGSGGLVTGRVLRADGTAVAGAEISYQQPFSDKNGFVSIRTLTIKPADADGRYALDFVLQNPLGGFILTAKDPATGEEGSLTARIRANGERLTLDLVLLGRGSVEGTVRDAQGAPIPGAVVTVRSLTDLTARSVNTDQHGVWRVDRVAVGPVGIDAAAVQGRARASAAVTGSGQVTRADLVIFAPATAAIAGVVRLPDGAPAAGIRVYLAADAGGVSAGDGGLLDAVTADDAGAFRFEGVAPGAYTAQAIDPAFALTGSARFAVTSQHSAANPVFVTVLLNGTGSVSGRVLERVGAAAVPVPGALVAGGTQIVTADASGNYVIPAAPVGVQTIEAANPATGARGSRQVTILSAGQTSTGIDIVLEPLARVTGVVLDPDGHPVGGLDVRLIVAEGPGPLGGRQFFVRRTQTAADGSYGFDRLEPRDYPVTAVRGSEVANGRARLSPLVTLDVVNLRLVRPTGRVSGRVVDDTGLAVAARVVLRARVPNAAGVLELVDASTMTSDPDRGFTFTGVFPGPFTLTASSFFSPDSAVASGALSDTAPVAENITLTLTRNTGRLRGCVLTPDGGPIAPVLDGAGVPRALSVFITSPLLRNDLAADPQNVEPDGIRVDASSGCFVSTIPLPPDFYTIQVTDDRAGSPTFGLTGQATAIVERGPDTLQDVRLLGRGALAVEIVDGSGQPLRGVAVTASRMTYPNEVRDALVLAPTVGAPFVFEGLSEGPVSVRAVVSTDPAVNVGGRDELRGFGGLATGAVVREGTSLVRLVVDAAGSVSGRFLRADGVTAVPSAQVTLSASGGDIALAVTDAGGAFRFDGVRVGSFTLDGFDPATGRRAKLTGQVQTDAQRVVIDLELGPIGRVRGVVVDVSRTQPIAGADVSLAIAGEGEARQVTSRLDGSFVFESVPGGTYPIVAASSQGLSGQADITIATEGEEVDVIVVLQGSGRVQGVVRSALGAAVASAEITLVLQSGQRRFTQAGAAGGGAGAFAFDVVPVGPFTIEARPAGALTPGDGARRTGVIAGPGQTVDIDLTFEGTITVGAAVSGLSGASPVLVTLQSAGLFGGVMTPSTVQGNVFVFDGVPRAPFTVSARQPTPSGAIVSASASRVEADLPAPGQRLTPDVALSLTQVATIAGTVTRTTGEPSALARVTLTAGPVMVLGVSGADGRFEFVGIPLSVDLSLMAEGADGSRAVFLGSVGADGQVRDAAGQPVSEVALVLDSTPPQVQQVMPAQGAVAVPTSTAVVVMFSEPLDRTTVRVCGSTAPASPTFSLLENGAAPIAINDPANPCDDSNVVPLALTVSADGRVVSLAPLRTLAGVTQHTVVVHHGAIDSNGVLIGGVRDLVGQPLAADFVAPFVTRDDAPPTVLTMSPASGATNIADDSVGRITFSEPIAPASVTSTSITLTGPAGPVTGRLELILGNTVVVFTPIAAGGARALLQSDQSYTLRAAGVADIAGNVQRPQDTAVSTFSTRDTLAPTIASIDAPLSAHAGTAFSVSVVTAAADVRAVDVFVDGQLVSTIEQPSAPGRYQTVLTMPEHAVAIAARATDTAGNVGALGAPVSVALAADLAPLVAITAPAANIVVAPGATVRFSVLASDDVGVAEARGAASGVVTSSQTRAVSPAQRSVPLDFDIVVPESAPNGTLTFAAIARDSRGQSSALVSRAVRVERVAAPSITGVQPRFATRSFSARVVEPFVVTGANLQGATFLFVPATLPPAIAIDTASVNAEGTVATLRLTIAPSAAGTFVLVASGPGGSSGTTPSAGNRLIVVDVQSGSDFDQDGMPDAFEVQYGFDPTDPADAAQDADGDGRSNLEEYQLGTDPRNPDATPPTVALIDPADGASGVPTNAVVIVRFTERVRPDSASANSVQLLANGAPIAGAVTLSNDRLSVSFAPAAPLQGQTTHQVIVSGVRDEAGNTMATPFTSAFETAVFADTTAPTLVATSPADGATDVPVNAPILVEFSEPMDPATLVPANFTVYDPLIGQYVAGLVQVDPGTRRAAFVPAAPLALGRGYQVTLTQNLHDAASNPLAGQYGFSFAVGFAADVAAPQLVVTSPMSGSTDVPTNAIVVLDFDEPLNPVTAVRGLRLSAGPQPIDGSTSLSNGNRRLTVVSAAPLPGTTVVTVHGTSDIADLVNHAADPLPAFSFTTGAAPDFTPPAIASIEPAPGTIDAPPDTVVTVRFTERVNPTTVSAEGFQLVDHTAQKAVAGARALNASGDTLTFTPAAPLEPGRVYSAQIGLALFVDDLAGNHLFRQFPSFVVASAPVGTGPQVLAVSPAANQQDVPVNARVRLRVDRTLQAQSVTAETVRVSTGVGDVSGDIVLSPDGRVVTWTAAASLPVSATFSVIAQGLRDLAGATMTPKTWTFTTGAVDTADLTGPSVAVASPVNGATGVALTTPYVLTFTEPIEVSSVTQDTLPVQIDGVAGVVAGSYSVAGATVTFTPTSPWPAGSRVRISVAAVTDLAGNFADGVSLTFGTGPPADLAPPTVTLVTPGEMATDIGPQTPVVLSFSEALRPETIGPTTFALYANGVRLDAEVIRSADNRTVTLRTTMPAAAIIVVSATHDVTDLAGNPLADFMSVFQTASDFGFDAGRPSVVSQRPENGAFGVGRDRPIALYVNETLDPATLANALHVAQNGVAVEGEVEVTGNGRAIVFRPAAPWAASALVQVFVLPAARDVYGNALNRYEGQFRTESDPASEPPAIVRLTPTHGGQDVVRNAVIEIEFSEPIDPSTAPDGVVTVSSLFAAPVMATRTLGGDGRVLRWVFAAGLAANTPYHFVDLLPPGLADLQGQAYPPGFFYQFSTGVTIDTTDPIVTSVGPPAGASGVGLNAGIRVRFSERVNPLSVTPTTVRLLDGVDAIALTGARFAPGDTEVLIEPQSALAAGRTYTIAIAGVTDLAGRLVSPHLSTFVTGAEPDTSGPVVVRAEPSEIAGVPLNSVFVLELNEPIDPATVTVDALRLFDQAGNAYVPGTTTVSTTGRVITFAPDAPLAVGRAHTVYWSYLASARDHSGNVAPTAFFSFVTGFTPDTIAPHVALVSPADGLTGVPTNARISITFDEPIRTTALSGLRLLAGTEAAVARDLSNGNRTVTLRPLSALRPLTVYTVRIEGVVDLSGRPLDSPVQTTFTTAAGADLTSPQVLTIEPANLAVDVAPASSVTVQFSERVNPATIGDGAYRLVDNAAGRFVPGTVTLDASARTLTFTPAAPLVPGRNYGGQIGSIGRIEDLGGNALGQRFHSFTVGVAPAGTGPQIVAMSPQSAMSGAPVNTIVRISFDRPILLTSVTAASVEVSSSGVATGAVSVSDDRRTVSWTPSVVLAPSTFYTVRVQGLRDLSGATMTATTWMFVTRGTAAADLNGPTLTSVMPANNDVDVPLTTPIVATFNESIDPTSVSMTTLQVRIDATSLFIGGAYAVNGPTVTFTPYDPWPSHARIRFSVEAIADYAGNTTAGESTSFTTASVADLTPPAVTLVTPGDGAVDIASPTEVVLSFSEALAPDTVNDSTLALYASGVRLGVELLRSADNRTVTLRAALPPASVIAVLATSGVADLAGNPLADFVSVFNTALDFGFDSTRPAVVMQRPANGATGVAGDRPIAIYFTEPLDASTTAGALHVSQQGALVQGATSLSADGRVLTFTPATPWTADALVQVFLDTSAADRFGNPLNPYESHFRTAADPSTQAPALVRLSPVNSATAVPLNVAIEWEISEPLDPATLPDGLVTVTPQFLDPLLATRTLTGNGRVVRWVFSGPLAPDTIYVFPELLPPGVRDLQGQPLVSVAHGFLTGDQADAVAPTLTAVSPPPGSSGIGVNAGVRLLFDERINPISVTASTVRLSDGLADVPFGEARFSPDDREVVLEPQSALQPNRLYTITVDGVADRSGHVVTFTASFATGAGPDTASPIVVRVEPSPEGAPAPVNTVVRLELSEPIDPASVTADSFRLIDALTSAVVPGTPGLGANRQTASFVPDAPLTTGRPYSVYWSYLSAVRDFTGNVGVAAAYTFQTGFGADTAAPIVTLITPAAGSTAVPTNARIVVAFDEPVVAVTAAGVTLRLGNEPVACVREIGNGQRTVTLRPSAPLRPMTGYTIHIEGVTDLAGHVLETPVQSTFTTGAGPDFVSPSVIAIEPADGAVSVPPDAPIVLHFDESLDRTTFAEGYRLLDTVTGQFVAGTLSSDPQGLTLTFVPATALEPGRRYQHYISYPGFMIDVAGNLLPRSLVASFVTAAP